jgi:hypothetical protein
VSRVYWTPENLETLKTQLARSATVGEASRRLETRGLELSPNAIKVACKRHLGRPPIEFLGTGIVDEKPVARSGILRGLDNQVDYVAAKRVKIIGKQERKLFDSQIDRLHQLEIEHDALSRLHATPLPPIEVSASDSSGRRECAAVALLSDVHYGEIIEKSRSTFGNKYNTTIATYRLRRFFTGVEWLIQCNRSWADIKHLILWLGGDMVNGQIHQEHFETSQSPIDSLIELQPILVAGIRRLLELDIKITLPCSYGNHGRTTEKKQCATGARHSYEYLMYNTLASILKSDGVSPVVTPEPHQFVDVYGRTLHFTHGDDTKYNGGVGGISIALNKAIDAWHKVNPSYLSHIGHYHTLFDGGRWITNGSLCGYNAFAMSIKATPEVPQQWFYILDSKRGRSTRSPIWVSDSVEEDNL